MKKKDKKVNKKTNNKIMKTIKISTIILAIILISMISFFGIYAQNKAQVSNKVKDYTYAMDINGARTLKLELNSETADENKTEENYEKAKNIIEKRLKSSGVQNYNISLNEENGEMTIEIPEDDTTDYVVGNLSTVGKFQIIDTETEEVLLDNNDIKSSDVLYSTTETGTAVYLEIAFDKEGKVKLEEISNTYVHVEHDEEAEESEKIETEVVEDETAENENSEEQVEDTTDETSTEKTSTEEEVSSEEKEKTITMKIDDEEIMTTAFEEPITTGSIQLTVGGVTTDPSTLQDYIKQAQNMATILDNGNLPLQYDLARNQYILSDITEQHLINIAIAIAVVIFVGIIVLIAKYKTNGFLAGISYIGLVALYLLLIRYANVIISIESIFGIAIMLILNYIFTLMLLNNIKTKEKTVNKATIETYAKFFNRIIPICIAIIAFCFVKWIPISSFGMISFWGLVLIAVYNAVITRSMLNILEVRG